MSRAAGEPLVGRSSDVTTPRLLSPTPGLTVQDSNRTPHMRPALPLPSAPTQALDDPLTWHRLPSRTDLEES